MADPAPFKYRAFLSYSHRDKAWGERLHRALETYRIGRDLVGRTTPAGPVPGTLRPIFRDREDFSAGPSLAAQTIAALEASQFLIVICSPNAAKSEYVNEEVRRFKALGRSDSIIPVIVGGNPGEPDSECFPPALRFKVGPDGGLTGERDEPIAADARSSGDGKGLAIGKVVAGLLGVGLDEIIRRAERERRRRTRFWSALAGAFLGLAIIATGSAVYAWQQLKTNEEFLDATLERFTSLVNRAVNASQSYSLPVRVTLGFLEEAEGILNVMARYGRPTPRLRQRQIAMLIAFGDSYRELGRTADAQRRIVEAQRLASELARDNAADPIARREQARAHQRLGDVEMARGDLAAALREFRAVREIFEGLLKADPGNTPYRRDLSIALERIGNAQVAQGQFDEAFATFKALLVLRQQLSDAAPASLELQEALGCCPRSDRRDTACVWVVARRAPELPRFSHACCACGRVPTRQCTLAAPSCDRAYACRHHFVRAGAACGGTGQLQNGVRDRRAPGQERSAKCGMATCTIGRPRAARRCAHEAARC